MTDETALYRYTCEVYDKLYEESKTNEHEERLFEGSMVEVFKQTGASSRYYSSIRKLLISPELDPCVTFMQRGNGSQPTIIRLHHEPPQDWKKISQKGLTAPREGATMLLQIEAELSRLKAWRESIGEVNLSEALRDFDKRLRVLERKQTQERE
jgi:hypothetical protein